MYIALTVIQVIICILLIITVLLQSGRSAGLSGAIAGGAETLFGKKKGLDDLLGRITAVLAGLFLLITLIIALVAR
ncbi:MAG: preprotein translocase subunit SecG [Clostridia bacterium]|nr:preprotein translocase subunit SecG [Clostridia bacterium]